MSAPLVSCGEHQKRPAFIVCVHVMAGEPAAHYIAATHAEMGEALCARCHATPGDLPLSDLKLMCDLCVRQHVTVTQ